MSTTFGKSTYAQLLFDAYDDVADDRTGNIPDSTVKTWILEAERKICEQFEVRDRYVIGLNAGVDEYAIQDRPPITGATNATPIVITAINHGLTTGDRVTIRDVRGNTAANGRFQVVVLTADTFRLFGWVDVSEDGTEISSDTIGIRSDVVAVTAGVLTVTYGTPLSSASYALDAKFYDSDGNWVIDTQPSAQTATGFTITIPDTGTLKYVAVEAVEIIITGATTSTVLANSVGNGAYISGGRFWRDDELPTWFRPNAEDIVTRTWGNFTPIVKVVEIDTLLEQQRHDTSNSAAYSDYDSPTYAAEWSENGKRFFKVYPAPRSDQEAEIYGRMHVNPRDYYTDFITDMILLPFTFDEAITHYIKSKVYKRLKDKKSEFEELALFGNALNELKKTNVRHVIQRVDYV